MTYGHGFTRSPPNDIKVLISGAGTGGLMTALECWKKGCEVRIIERASVSNTQGDSYTIGPSAINAVCQWPEMKKDIDRIAYDPLFAMNNVKLETLKGPMKVGAIIQEGSKAERIGYYMRPEFQEMLLSQLDKIGVEVEYERPVVDYFEDEKSGQAGVVLQDGSRLQADVVVAADGIRTASSPLVVGEPVPAKSSGHAIFRVAYPVELAVADPLVAERFKLDKDGNSVLEMFHGPDTFGLFWRNDKWMNWAIDHLDSRGTSEESWSNRVDSSEALKFTATIPGWSEVANRVIKATPANTLVDWTLMWRDPQPKWTSPGGRVVQIGDAAHTFIPSSGNGGTQAIEDAVSLATCIAAAGKNNLPNATRVHNLLRFERVSFIQAMGVANRDRHNTNKAKHKQNRNFVWGTWLVDHNPEEYALDNFTSALANITTGAPFKNSNTPPGVAYQPWTMDGLAEALEKGEPSILDGDWI
ncbi:FAD/NAD(P)-binding domain-containing protein [Tothia fuscella]|uniref:FAD/NAD(P)-binding domain-containing protein n=1 Tax=Tothia fuscella TaxID=1048955 RepID=A0A9P4NIH9_9PEZI|nr:FAD/NAD(P)-binding domain-containing protein [Tothia fuscella]